MEPGAVRIWKSQVFQESVCFVEEIVVKVWRLFVLTVNSSLLGLMAQLATFSTCGIVTVTDLYQLTPQVGWHLSCPCILSFFDFLWAQ